MTVVQTLSLQCHRVSKNNDHGPVFVNYKGQIKSLRSYREIIKHVRATVHKMNVTKSTTDIRWNSIMKLSIPPGRKFQVCVCCTWWWHAVVRNRRMVSWWRDGRTMAKINWFDWRRQLQIAMTRSENLPLPILRTKREREKEFVHDYIRGIIAEYLQYTYWVVSETDKSWLITLREL